MNHTEGPWRIGNAKYSEAVSPWREAIAIEAPHDPVGGPDDAPSVVAWLTRCGEQHANAALISAAPDMLAALRLYDKTYCLTQSHPTVVEEAACMAAVRVVLARIS